MRRSHPPVGLVLAVLFGLALLVVWQQAEPDRTEPTPAKPPAVTVATPRAAPPAPAQTRPAPKPASLPSAEPVAAPSPAATSSPSPAPAARTPAVPPSFPPVGSFSSAHAYAGLPRAAATLALLRNRAYTVGYDESLRNPAWASYRLPAEILPQRFPRPNRFRTDARTRALVRHEDYAGGGYDRGHLAPNHAIATRFGAEAQEETFLMSNVIPQAPDLNQGPWRELESALAERAAPAAREIWVAVGPVYRGSPARLASGSAIPDACFMVIADETPRGPRFQAFLAPQSGSRKADFRSYLASVDAVERATGLDFHPDLDDAAEAAPEAAEGPYWLEGD